MLKVTVVVDNVVYKHGLLAEHGLSLLVEYDGLRILMDTGQGMALANNLDHLSISADSLDAVVLSHGHYDHTGGIPALLERATKCLPVYAHPSIFEPCFSNRGGIVHSIGVPAAAEPVLRSARVRLVDTASPTRVADAVWASGAIPRAAKHVPTEAFFRARDLCQANTIEDDQSLYVATPRGTVVITGCAHAGVINILEHAKAVTGRAVCAIIGGMHLVRTSAAQRAEIAAYMRAHAIEVVVPLHCSGEVGRAALAADLPQATRLLGTGDTLELPL